LFENKPDLLSPRSILHPLPAAQYREAYAVRSDVTAGFVTGFRSCYHGNPKIEPSALILVGFSISVKELQ
jgi:hypothetical protein